MPTYEARVFLEDIEANSLAWSFPSKGEVLYRGPDREVARAVVKAWEGGRELSYSFATVSEIDHPAADLSPVQPWKPAA